MGANIAKERKKDRITEGQFVSVNKFDGSVDEIGERKGEGALYLYQNGDRYGGDWEKGLKHGYGIYIYANGKSVRGWFDKDVFIGSQPNEKLKKELKKKNKASAGSEPLSPFQSLLTLHPESDSERKTRVSTSRKDIPRKKKSYKLPSKKEKRERQRASESRRRMRTKYRLPEPSRKNPLLNGR